MRPPLAATASSILDVAALIAGCPPSSQYPEPPGALDRVLVQRVHHIQSAAVGGGESP